MDPVTDWLYSPENPPIRYRTARDVLGEPAPVLSQLHADMFAWPPLVDILDLQRADGSFGNGGGKDARATFWALRLFARCGLDCDDEPVARSIAYLETNHHHHALSYTGGASGVLPCYVGVTVEALIRLGALDSQIVQDSLQWLVDHQRFDHRATRAGGDHEWPYRAPINYGCWESVSCYHGVAGAFRALAAVPPDRRSAGITQRLDAAVEYLRIHRLYRKSATNQPLFRHMTRFSLVADYRSDLLDMLGGIAALDPGLSGEAWVAEAIADMEDLAPDGRVELVQNYGKRLIDPVPFEPVGAPSRFLTLEWLLVRRALLEE